jgi:hypothetical protein
LIRHKEPAVTTTATPTADAPAVSAPADETARIVRRDLSGALDCSEHGPASLATYWDPYHNRWRVVCAARPADGAAYCPARATLGADGSVTP